MSDILLDKVNQVHLENLGTIDTPSIFIKVKDYSILNLRYLKLNSGELVNCSDSYFISNNVIFSVNENRYLKEIPGQFEELHQVINGHIQYLNQLIETHYDAVEKLEDKVFARTKLGQILSEWYEHKRSLLKLNRAFERLSIVLVEFVNKEKDQIKNYSEEYMDLIEDCGVCTRLIRSQLEKLDGIFSYYTSIKNDSLNKNIFVLSIISGVFLPLNLIVGFFGMNTTGLFFANHANGTQIIFNILIFLFAILLIGLPILNLIDKLVVSKLFGRYKFYSKISKKIEHLSDDFNILERKD